MSDREFPQSFKVGPFDYEVEAWNSLSAESRQAYGECSRLELKIRVAENIPLQKQGETLLHEILHAVAAQQYILADDEDQEEVVRPMSLGLAATMRDNPEAFEWILEALQGAKK